MAGFRKIPGNKIIVVLPDQGKKRLNVMKWAVLTDCLPAVKCNIRERTADLCIELL